MMVKPMVVNMIVGWLSFGITRSRMVPESRGRREPRATKSQEPGVLRVPRHSYSDITASIDQP